MTKFEVRVHKRSTPPTPGITQPVFDVLEFCCTEQKQYYEATGMLQLSLSQSTKEAICRHCSTVVEVRKNGTP